MYPHLPPLPHQDFVDGNGIKQLSSITFLVNICGNKNPISLQVGLEHASYGEKEEGGGRGEGGVGRGCLKKQGGGGDAGPGWQQPRRRGGLGEGEGGRQGCLEGGQAGGAAAEQPWRDWEGRLHAGCGGRAGIEGGELGPIIITCADLPAAVDTLVHTSAHVFPFIPSSALSHADLPAVVVE